MNNVLSKLMNLTTDDAGAGAVENGLLIAMAAI
jgi:Flp pilus assembly pilin Flp